MATTQYIGSRYVPLFADPIEWSSAKSYEALTIVLHNGNSFTSRQYVPIGVSIDNEEYWAETGNYNAQIEQYRREVADAVDAAGNALNAANDAQNDIDTLLPKEVFSETNTVQKYVNDSISDYNSEIENQKENFALFERTIVCEKLYTTTKDFAANLQGCASDGTYIYIYYDGNTFSVIQKVAIADGSIVRTQRFDVYLGHGNSFNHDPLTGRLILYSSNRTVTVLDTDLNVISIARDTGRNSYQYSQFAMNNNFAVANISASNSFVLYQRVSADLYSAYKTCQIYMPRYMYNILQDCVIYNNTYISLIGANTSSHYIATFGVTGTYFGFYKLDMGTREPEGICCDSTYMYVINTDGEIYRFNLNKIPDGLNVSGRVNLPLENTIFPMSYSYYPSFVTNRSDIYNKYFYNYKTIQTRAPKLKTLETLTYDSISNGRVNIAGNNGIGFYTTSTGSIRIRSKIWGSTYDCLVNYEPSTDGDFYYLSDYSIYNGSQRVARLVLTESTTFEDIDTAIDAFVDACAALTPAISPRSILFGFTNLGYVMSNFLVISTSE